jgi:hypothetical protein
MSSQPKGRMEHDSFGIEGEVAEGDALEQSRSVDGDDLESTSTPSDAPEVPEADAIEQSIEVPDEDGYERS